MAITSRPYKMLERNIELPKEPSAWPSAITNILSGQLSGITPTETNVQFKKIDEASLTAIGSASVVVDGRKINFPVIIVGGKMFPLDIAMDDAKNMFPWHPFFVSIINTDSLSVISKKGQGLHGSERAQKRFIRKIINMKKPSGFKDVLKNACQDPAVLSGLVRNSGKEVIAKMLGRGEIKSIRKSFVAKDAEIVPGVRLEPSAIHGPACIITTDGVKRATGFDVLGEAGSLTLTDDGLLSYSQEIPNKRVNGVKMACDKPSGYGIFYGVQAKRYMSTPPLNVMGKSGGAVYCMDNIGNNVTIKVAGEASKDGNTYYIGSKWKFAKINGVTQPSDRVKLAFDSATVSRNGMSYYLDGKKVGVGKEAATQALSTYYGNARDIIKAASKYGIAYVPKVAGPVTKEVRCKPLVNDFAKIASMVPSQYSAAALLDVALPIRESIMQMRQHIHTYQIAASALASDTMMARLTGNPDESSLSAAMTSLCDAGMVAVNVVRSAIAEAPDGLRQPGQ